MPIAAASSIVTVSGFLAAASCGRDLDAVVEAREELGEEEDEEEEGGGEGARDGGESHGGEAAVLGHDHLLQDGPARSHG